MLTDRPHECDGGDLVEMLLDRHEQIRDAFAELVGTHGQDKAALFDELVTTLAVHEAVAQELIHPLLVRQGSRAGGNGGPGEGSEVLGHLSRLSQLDVEDDQFDVELIKVARVVTLHLEAQERDDLALLRRLRSGGELHALADLLCSAETVASANASAIQPQAPSPDVVGPLDLLTAVGGWFRRAR